jgi:hypothetical protein
MRLSGFDPDQYQDLPAIIEDLPDDGVRVVVPDSRHLGVLEAVLIRQLVPRQATFTLSGPLWGALASARLCADSS